ncbi:related to GTPase-activating protein beta-chimerin [Phialocephala subalpina]|uniref:Related to GTPase-activating protein beta-chimerin n=1 Tax=Phialocephala subalpina TaxID=576137 RepID=A0A1L7WDY6_9HELO|nr:related to GTPase-activating protein beta-chimerin [Phialocephala subalpina]
MARKSTPQPLTLPTTTANDEHDFIDSPRSALSPKSPRSPRSPFRFNSKKSQSDFPSIQAAESQQVSTIPASQTSPSFSTQHNTIIPEKERERPSRSGFFSNYKASKSSSRLQNQERQQEEMSRDTDPAMSAKVSTKENSRTDNSTDKTVTRRPVGGPSRSDASLDLTGESVAGQQPTTNTGAKKAKPKPFSILSRTKSIRDEQSPREPSPKHAIAEPEPAHTPESSLKTAPLPLEHDRSFRHMMSSTIRQRSEDRTPTMPRDRSQEKAAKEGSKLKGSRDNSRSQTTRDPNKRSETSFSNSFNERGGQSFLSGLKTHATKGAGALSKGLFGKGRANSTTEKEPVVDDEHYQLKVLNLPLVEQTRKTRISKKLEESRDKTEFWMPAFPWRAIDYLNYKGSDVEGLYRVPGSTPEIKKWQRKFDELFDVDLFEQPDLYDINIIGSMLKAWFRELQDELLPKAIQERIARECSGSEEVPQMLVDELSNLSPFNYYLLFAITCHLSLLLAHSDKNKMDYRNLCICFQPCLKIDAFCFRFLVCNWRDCWKGCKNEAQYIEQEYMLFNQVDMLPPSSAEGRSSTAIESERNVSSSDSSKPSSIDNSNQKAGGNQNKKLPFSQGSTTNSGTVNTTLTVVAERAQTPPNSDMRPLSPIKPLSPLGL